jgi:hypothetical protein
MASKKPDVFLTSVLRLSRLVRLAMCLLIHWIHPNPKQPSLADKQYFSHNQGEDPIYVDKSLS